MAAVSLSPLPPNLSSMSTRRAPLSNNSNAVNSPFRAVAAAAIATKQKRSYANIQREESYGQPPPAKKQMLESRQVLRTPPGQQQSQTAVESRVYTRKTTASQSSTFERRNIPARERPQQNFAKVERISKENLETVRIWQRHYRKIFPNFVFYFENVAEEIHVKFSKQVVSLGAREEKFFSNAVTHVVTTRNIPPEVQHISTDSATASSAVDSQLQTSQPQTINPSLLDRSSESANTNSDVGAKPKFTLEAPSTKRLVHVGNDADPKKQQGRGSDLLQRARELKMKIWALEKLERILSVMFDGETAYQAHGHNTRSSTAASTIARSVREADLSQLLRNERINGPSDRDFTVVTKELNVFKGPYIYIHDIDEKQRPIMVREYAKVQHREDGDWPQFRSVSGGKCPFIEEVDHTKRETQREREQLRLRKQQQKEKATNARSRAGSATPSKMQPPGPVTGKRVLADLDDIHNRTVMVSTKQINPFVQSKASFRQRLDQVSPSRGNQNAFVSRAGAGCLYGGEPVASGVQPSITSAIRSVVTSSTAAQPGLKAGTSKEVHGLQRKVLEKTSGGPGSYGLASSHRMTDIIAAGRDDGVARPNTRRAQEKLSLIEEHVDLSEVEDNTYKMEVALKTKAIQQRKIAKRDPKPGYCENCQDKFDDFDEHILSHKHRKFAEKLENWKQLDELLAQLRRPVRDQQEEYENY